MYEGFLLNPDGPQGDKIRSEIGNSSYAFLPNPEEFFFCPWHNLEKAELTAETLPPTANVVCSFTAGEDCYIPCPERSGRLPIENLPCEGYFSPSPEGIGVDVLMNQGFHLEALPDGRQVFFIPNHTAIKQLGPFTPTVWKRLVDNINDSRAKVIRHAYQVTLGVLQIWRRIGPSMARVRECNKDTEEGREAFFAVLQQIDPSGRNRKLEEWISYWAEDLHNEPAKEFKPHLEARKVLARATGLGAANIGTIVGRG